MAQDVVLQATGLNPASNMAQRELFLRNVFAVLNAAAIRYVVPRNWEELPSRPGRDLDILIPAKQLRLAVRLISDAGVRADYICILHVADGQGLVVDAIPCRSNPLSGAAQESVSFDLRTYISFKPNEIAIPGFTRKIFADQFDHRVLTLHGCSIRVLGTIDEFVCLYFQYQVKRSSGNHSKAKDYADRLKQLLLDPNLAAWFRRTAQSLDGNLTKTPTWEAESWQAIASALLRARWGRHSMLRWLVSQTCALAIRARFLSPRFGPLVYFSGPDGAGKTTVVGGLTTRLRENGVRFKSLYSLKILLRAITKRLAFLKHLGVPGAVSDKDKPYQPPDLLFLTEDSRDRDTGTAMWRYRKLAALLVGIADIWLGWLLVLPLRLCGWVVLIETSPHDIFIKYHMPEFPMVERIVGPLLPRPTVAFLLVANPQTIVQRKAELTVDEIEDYYCRFSRLLDRCRVQDRYRKIRTDIDPEETSVLIVQTVLSYAV